MARSLAFGPYSHFDVMARLASTSCPVGCRFDLLDNSNQVIGSLDTITAATVSADVDRKINGMLTMDMLGDRRLVDQLLQRRVRPWFRIRMGDGGVAEWAMGIYQYTEPDRTVEAVGVDLWRISMPDLTYLPESSGPDLPGYTAPAFTFVLTHVENILRTCGITDFSGIEPTGAQLPSETFWGLVRVIGVAGPGPFEGIPIFEQGQTSPQTWLDILATLHQGGGAYAPWVNNSGSYRFQRSVNLATAPPSIEYTTRRDQLVTGFDTSNDVSLLANRVVARANNTGGFFGFEIADADVLIPSHPLAQHRLGRYMSVTIDVPTATDSLWLQLAARKELFMRLSRHKTVKVRTMPNPAHERNEIVGLTFEDDVEFAAGARFLERGWTLDLFAGAMDHTMYLLVEGT